MKKCTTKAIQADLGRFTHSPAYSDIFKNNQVYPGIIQVVIFKHIQKPDIFRTHITRHIQNQKHIQKPIIFRTLPNIYDRTFCENS